MSKSKFNGVEPESVWDEHGIDTTRLLILADVAPRSSRHWSKDSAYILSFISQSRLGFITIFHIYQLIYVSIILRRDYSIVLIEFEIDKLL